MVNVNGTSREHPNYIIFAGGRMFAVVAREMTEDDVGQSINFVESEVEELMRVPIQIGDQMQFRMVPSPFWGKRKGTSITLKIDGLYEFEPGLYERFISEFKMQQSPIMAGVKPPRHAG